ncbi:hypothetical protein V5O48_017700 [Marasmius crinis-equi]|uniref:C2H2-type domain-containing protein n=1 Tax=Marasmius crinis-equi TaxID=585013 RepID=A0ABR3EN85_9AGAR
MSGRRIPCRYEGCTRTFALEGHCTRHINSGIHKDGYLRVRGLQPKANASVAPQATPADTIDWADDDLPPETSLFDDSFPTGTPPSSPSLPSAQIPNGQKKYHPILTSEKCDADGRPLPHNTPPQSPPDVDNPWEPFLGEASYRLADTLFTKAALSGSLLNELLDIWALDIQSRFEDDSGAPFGTQQHLYETIDAIQHGGVRWQCFETQVDVPLVGDVPDYLKTPYQVWYRDPDKVLANILSNPDFANDFDPAPYVHIATNGKRCWSDFMSGNYAFGHATKIYEEEGDITEGAMYCGVMLSANKTTVSVATGNVEYHPLYMSIGNLHNSARRGYRGGVALLGFLAIPKAGRKHDNGPEFRTFKKRLYHSSIAAILSSLKPAMTVPVVRLCPDGYYRRIIYDLAAFIADYPEQVLLAGIVQGWCPRCSASSANLDDPGSEPRTRRWTRSLLEEYSDDGDILWDVFGLDNDILPFTHYFPRADIHEIITADILHQVVKGCFKDMLVEWVLQYIKERNSKERAEAIIDDIDRRIAVVPSFPGLRRFPHGRRFKQWTGDDSKALMKAVQTAVDRFHDLRSVFIKEGIRTHFSIPRMHSMAHYPHLIMAFGAPNGVCSSITESRHITAVKKPWRRSNRNNPLSQILLTNQQLDKFTALRSRLAERKLIPPVHVPPRMDAFDIEEDDEGAEDSERLQAEVKLAKTRAEHIRHPELLWLTRQFLHEQIYGTSPDDIPLDELPEIHGKVDIFHSAVAKFFAPSDTAGIRGMHRERIRACPSYFGSPRFDMVAVLIDHSRKGFQGMSAARIIRFFSFKDEGTSYQCALVHWFNTYGRSRDTETGMWVVQPAYRDAARRRPHLAVIHVDTLFRGLHLVPMYGSQPVPSAVKFHQSLDLYTAFYVNKYADYHANETIN